VLGGREPASDLDVLLVSRAARGRPAVGGRRMPVAMAGPAGSGRRGGHRRRTDADRLRAERIPFPSAGVSPPR